MSLHIIILQGYHKDTRLIMTTLNNFYICRYVFVSLLFDQFKNE